MAGIRLSLVDDDYVVRAKTDLDYSGPNNRVELFFKEMSEELITGKSAYLEIEGSNSSPITLEISKLDA